MSQHRQLDVSEFGFFKIKTFTLQVNLSQYYLQLQTQKSTTNIFLGFYWKCGLMWRSRQLRYSVCDCLPSKSKKETGLYTLIFCCPWAKTNNTYLHYRVCAHRFSLWKLHSSDSQKHFPLQIHFSNLSTLAWSLADHSTVQITFLKTNSFLLWSGNTSNIVSVHMNRHFFVGIFALYL